MSAGPRKNPDLASNLLLQILKLSSQLTIANINEMVEEKSRDTKEEILIEITDCKEDEKSTRNKLLLIVRRKKNQ